MTEPTFSASVLEEYDLGPDERRLLAEAERTLAELDRIAVELEGAPLMLAGSTGQMRAHPLLSEARAHRELLGKLLARLALPDDDEEDQEPTLAQRLASSKAQRAANARWGKEA